MSRDAMRCHVMSCHLLCSAMGWNAMSVNQKYYKCYKVLLCTTMYLHNTTPYCKVLQSSTLYYKVLQSTTPSYKSTAIAVLQTSTLPFTANYYKVLQNTTKYCSALLRTTKYYSVLQSTTQY